MDYYGLLFLYYLKGLSGKSVLRLFFNIEAGGTEQLLPENTSTPTTTPILADIQYPDGLRTDQYFTYRETPTTVSNKARIKTIKGQTIKWNQLAKVMESFTSATSNGVTLSRVDDHLHIQGTATSTATFNSTVNCNEAINFPPAHKFLLSINPKNVNVLFGIQGYGLSYYEPSISVVRPSSETTDWQGVFQFRVDSGVTVNTDLYLQAFDLTAMGLADKTDADIFQWFADYFPLSYYSFNRGSLIPFMGNGIKTTGKNESDIPFEQGAVSQTVNFSYQASKVSSATRIRCVSLAVAEKDKIYKCDWNTSVYDCVIQAYDENRLSTGASVSPFNNWFTVPFTFTGTGYVAIAFKRKDGANITPSEIDAIRPNLYLADTESIANLPISTYFPTGMKSAGSVYDELTESKAITRIGMVDLGSLTYEYFENYQCFASNGVITDSAVLTTSTVPNFKSIYEAVSWIAGATNVNRDMVVCLTTSSYQLRVRNKNFTDPTAFKTAMNGVYLYYELATPTETPITTEDANEALSLLMGKSVSSSNAKQMIDIITKGE